MVLPPAKPSAVDMDSILSIEQLVRDLKVDRDTWQAVALQFKAAFEAQTARLQEFQDICFATQVELENERTQHERVDSTSMVTEGQSSPCFDGLRRSFGTATIHPPALTNAEYSQRPFNICTNPIFDRAHECIEQKKYGDSLTHVERSLCGPVSSKTRAEGLLLKSIVLRALGAEEISNALAACIEAIGICDRVSELECFLPQLQNQRSLLYHELRMLHQARDNLDIANNPDHMLSFETSGPYNSEHHQNDLLHYDKRRSGFDEIRTGESLLAQLKEKAKDNKCRRTSMQLKQHAVARTRQISSPHYWVKSRRN